MERDEADVGSLSRFLDGEFWGMKNELRRQIADSPLYQQRYDLSLDEIRDLTMERVKFVMSLPQVQHAFNEMIDKKKNFVNKSMIMGEVLCTADMTTGVKCGVICWLFGGAVMNLGSPEHIQKWFVPLKVLDLLLSILPTRLPRTPASCLLGFKPSRMRYSEFRLAQFVLLADRIHIAFQWKQPVLHLQSVISRVNVILLYEKLSAIREDTVERFSTVWEPWLSSPHCPDMSDHLSLY